MLPPIWGVRDISLAEWILPRVLGVATLWFVLVSCLGVGGSTAGLMVLALEGRETMLCVCCWDGGGADAAAASASSLATCLRLRIRIWLV